MTMHVRIKYGASVEHSMAHWAVVKGKRKKEEDLCEPMWGDFQHIFLSGKNEIQENVCIWKTIFIYYVAVCPFPFCLPWIYGL